MIRVESRDDGRVSVIAGFREKERIKQIPGALWKQDERIWTVPESWAASKQLRGVFGDQLEIGDVLRQRMWDEWETRVQTCLQLRDAPDCPEVAPSCTGNVWRTDRETGERKRVPAELSPLQRSAVGFMVAGEAVVEGDPMGSGKTPVTICALKEIVRRGENPFPCLIICGNGAKPHWKDEFEDWWPGVEVSVITGNVSARRKALEADAHVYVINWESMIKHTRLAGYGNIKLTDKEKEPKELNDRTFKTVIADEIHRAKNAKAKQTRGLFAICDKTATLQKHYMYGLTGSLIGNTPVDLWAPMRSIVKKEYPAKSAFIERYALLSWNHFGGMAVVGLRGDTRDELFSFLDARFIRRPKDIILPELEGKLPPIRRDVILPPRQRKAYDKLRKEMLVELDGGMLMASNPMTRMMRLRQLAGATGEIVDNEVNLKDPSAKIDDFMNLVEELGGDSIACYAESRKLLELAAERCAKEGISYCLYTGAVDAELCEKQRAEFQAGRIQVIFLTYGAGAESINLSRADALARLEFSWSAIKNSQAEERPVRGDRQGPLRIFDIVAVDTVDETVIETYGDKLDMLEQVVRDEETLRRWLEA